MNCLTCDGEGKYGECGRCAGTGEVQTDVYTGAFDECPRCEGEGYLDCEDCAGTGLEATP